MSKILIVPDVHGRKFWHKAKEMINSVDKVVFLGDYLDPYSFEHISRLDAIKEFEEVIKFKNDNPDKVVLLLGNHDCAYCFDFGSASRYDYENEDVIKELFNNNSNLFQLYYLDRKCLFTHAGVTNDWLMRNRLHIRNLIEADSVPGLWDISYLRGGYCKTGSIIWSDVREGDRNETYYQIFGHTQLISEPIINNKWACLDCRKTFMVDTLTCKIWQQ